MWLPTVCFLAAFAVLPPVISAVSSGVEGPVICRARVQARLAETLEGKLEFLLVDALEGDAPAERFVVTIDHGYTEGVPATSLPGPGTERDAVPKAAVDEVFWLEGSLMDRETYFGEQYLFFGYPQLYLAQVKGGIWWPSQVRRMETLYLAPFSSLTSIYLVFAFPLMEEYTAGAYALILARFLVLCGAVAAAVLYRSLRRRWTPGLEWAVGAYLVVTVVLAVPSL